MALQTRTESDSASLESALESGGALLVIESVTDEQQSDFVLPNQRTPLHYACRFGRVDVVKHLITNLKYRIEGKDGNGYTSLHTAAQFGQLRTMKYLLGMLLADISLKVNTKLAHSLMLQYQQKLSQDHVDIHGNSLLHVASVYGKLEVVKFLVAEIGCDLYATNRDGMSCLHIAAQHGHLFLVKYLLEEVGSDLTLVDTQGRSAIYLAAEGGHINILKYLLKDRGVSPAVNTTATDIKGNPPKGPMRSLVYAASSGGHVDVIRYLVQQHSVHVDKNDASPLHIACRNGHLDMVIHLITVLKCDPNLPTDKGLTYLHTACYQGRLDIIKYLINEHRCKLCRDDNGVTPLHAAASHGSLDVVQYLIEEKQRDPYVKDVLQSKTVLHYASQNGHFDVVQYLCEIHHCDVIAQDKNKNTPLHLAAGKGHSSVVRYFVLVCNCDPLLKVSHNNTPFHYAAWHGRLQVVRFFIEEMLCDPYCRGDFGCTPLHLASENGHLEVVEYLVQHCDPLCPDLHQHTPLHRAANNGHLNVVMYLTMVKRCDPLVRSVTNNTPLHYAAGFGHLSAVKFFIEELKMDPYCRGDAGRISLHLACEYGHLEVVQYLAELCDPLSPDEDQHTPLHRAAFGGHLNVVRYLITSKSCDPVVRCDSDNTPLHYAAQQGHLEVVKFLIERVGGPNITGNFGRTALHFVCESGNLEVFYYLVQVCSPHLVDIKQQSPLHIAVSHNHVEIAHHLISVYHCNPKSVNAQGYTSLHLAALRGHLSLVKFCTEDKGCNPNTRDHFKSNCLHLACENGHLDVAKYLTTYCSPNSLDAKSRTPLHRAAANGHLEIIQYFANLYNNYSHLLTRDAEYNTYLHLAAAGGHLDVVKFLIERGCDPNVWGHLRRMPLHHASENGHLEVIKYLVTTHHCDPLCLDKHGNTPFHLAATFCEKLEVLRYFTFTLRCYTNMRNKLGNTPLHLAALYGRETAVKFFIQEASCDPNVQGYHARTPLHHAISKGHFNVSKYLIDLAHCDKCALDSSRYTPLHMAVYSRHLNIVMYLTCSHQLDPHEVPNQKVLYTLPTSGDILNYLKNYTDPLHLAARVGDMASVRHYIEKQCWSPMKQDKEGNNSLHLAAIHGQLEVVRYLTESLPQSICDPLVTNSQNQTAKALATKKGHMHVSAYLEELQGRALIRDLSHQQAKEELEASLASSISSTASAGATNNQSADRPRVSSTSSAGSAHSLSGSTAPTTRPHSSSTGSTDAAHWLSTGNTDTALMSSTGSVGTAMVDQGAASSGETYGPHQSPGLPPVVTGGPVTVPSSSADSSGPIAEAGQFTTDIVPSLNMLVLGQSGAGKSTLIKALVGGKQLIAGRLLPVKGVPPNTSGILCTTHDSKLLGNVNIYDFAGRECFQGSHEVMLHQFSHPIVLIVVNLCSPIKKQLSHWISLLNCTSSITCSTYHMLVIGSHVDRMGKKDAHLVATSCLQQCPGINYHGFVYTDCRYSQSQGMTQLREMVQNICLLIKQDTLRLSMMAFDKKCELLLRYLQSLSAKYLTLGVLSDQIKALDPSLSNALNLQRLASLCVILCTNGLLLYLPNKENAEDSMLILDAQSVLRQVHGCLKELQEYVTRDGTISEGNPDFIRIVSDSMQGVLSLDQVVKYFKLIRLCTVVDPHQLLSAQPQGPNLSTTLLFPGLVTNTKPNSLWGKDRTPLYSWELKCTGSHQFYTPLTVQRLFITLLEYARSINDMTYSIWKNGILLFFNNVWSLIEISHQDARLYLVMVARQGREMDLVKERSLLISLILNTVTNVYPKFSFDESLVPLQHSYLPPAAERIPVSEVALSIITGQRTVTCRQGDLLTSDLLFFDSFLMMDEVVIQAILAYRGTDTIVHKDVLTKVYEAVKPCQFLARLLQGALDSVSLTYSRLYKELSKYTIFSNRNIYVSQNSCLYSAHL